MVRSEAHPLDFSNSSVTNPALDQLAPEQCEYSIAKE